MIISLIVNNDNVTLTYYAKLDLLLKVGDDDDDFDYYHHQADDYGYDGYGYDVAKFDYEDKDGNDFVICK